MEQPRTKWLWEEMLQPGCRLLEVKPVIRRHRPRMWLLQAWSLVVPVKALLKQTVARLLIAWGPGLALVDQRNSEHGAKVSSRRPVK